MANFDFNTYMSMAQATAKATPSKPEYKVGYFKLEKDGDTAIVRFNYASEAEFHFATVHTLKDGKSWKKVSCLRTSFDEPVDNCPLCKAALSNEAIGKLKTFIYVEMLHYVKQEDGSYKPQAVVWERPAGFSKELVSLLSATQGKLKQCVAQITRNGTGTDTRYAVTLLPSEIYKPEYFPADFSAFDGYDLTKHGYYVKTREEMETFLAKGEFPKRVYTEAAPAASTPVAPTAPAAAPMPATPTVPSFGYTVGTPAATTVTAPKPAAVDTPAVAPVTPTTTPGAGTTPFAGRRPSYTY